MKPVVFRLLVLAIAIAVGLAAAPALLGGKADAPAPDFSLTTLDGEAYHLSDHRGKVVVLDFFATWCASCKITEGQLRDARATWDDGVQILSIDVDPYETEAEVRSYRDAVHLPWAVARDNDSVAQRYGVFELGRVIVVDGQGRVVSDKIGIVEADALRTAVASARSGDAGGIRLPQPGLLAVGAAAGAASFFSPCCAPMLPAYLAMGVPRAGEAPSALLVRRTREGSAAALGLLVVYATLGGLLILTGSLVRSAVPYFQPIAGIALIGVGAVALTRPATFDRLSALLAGMGGGADMTTAKTWRAHFLVGLGYGGASAGCTLPVVLQLAFAAAVAGPLLGGAALAAYALTAALLLVLFAVAPLLLPERALTALRRVAGWGRVMPIVMGVIFVAAGAAMLYVAARAAGLL